MSKAIKINFEKLLDIASTQSEVESLEYNLFELYQLYRKNYQMRRLLRAAEVPEKDKLDILIALPCFVPSKVFSELLKLILSKKLTKKIYYFYDNFGKTIDKKLGRVTVQIFSATQLPIEQTESLKLEIEKVLQKKVNLKAFVDESLLGGLIIKLPSGHIYDFTYKKLLTEFKYYTMEKN